MMKHLSYASRHALLVALSVMLAIIYEHYFSLTHEAFSIMAAFMLSQTTRGAPLHQALQLFSAMFLGLLFVTLAFTHFSVPTIVLCGGLIAVTLMLANATRWVFVFILTSMYALFYINQRALFEYRLYDMLIGGIIAAIVQQFILPVRIVAEFSKNLNKSFSILKESFQRIADVVNKKDIDTVNLKISCQQLMRMQLNDYPEWVYEVGFNPGLRAGYRYFLIQFERIIAAIYSMSYFLNMRVAEIDEVDELRSNVIEVLENNLSLIDILQDFFVQGTKPDDIADVKTDIEKLELIVASSTPQDVFLLSNQADYLRLHGLIRDLKDIRTTLLSLLLALP